MNDSNNAKNKNLETVAEKRMKERAKNREKKRRKEMPVSGKQVFNLKKIKDKKEEQNEE
jgi:hypothetical protein